MLKRYYIPSAVTFLRLLIAPIFFYAFLNNQYGLSLLLLAFAGITNLLDGYLARKMDSVSSRGAYLDVTADFILILTCFFTFTINGW
ncbi:MAG: CDP-alcohol phosphatidyltransferase family protein [Methanobacteriaceae archaeon]|nr:CDP-alcohol phosphatidyltransferase family protein [Methanobacteriaceae archaeon]